MNAGLLMAEQMLVPLATEMLGLAERLHRGSWENWDAETAEHLLHAVERINAALDLIMRSDGFEINPPPLTVQ
ncbi:hypothetical protein [Castellaniella sp.]|uniref:hypothetical protein n=1 Tax=Castellaniella sp. TaxID=1955812 RepID=UPI003A92F35B